jgi:hypothetical protein
VHLKTLPVRNVLTLTSVVTKQWLSVGVALFVSCCGVGSNVYVLVDVQLLGSDGEYPALSAVHCVSGAADVAVQ